MRMGVQFSIFGEDFGNRIQMRRADISKRFDLVDILANNL